MTDLLEPVVAEPPEPPLPTPRNRRRRIVGTVSTLVLLGVGVGLWALLPGAVAIGRTAVLLDARPFTCKDPSDVTTYGGGLGADEERVFVPAVRLHPGLDCTMTVVIRNDGDTDVAVDRITIPMAGSSNGWGVHADHGFQQGLAPIGGKDALDATFDYEHDPRSGGSFGVAAHSVERFAFHLSWSDGCMDDGSAATFTDAPTAVISAGPWHLEQRWAGPGYSFLGGAKTVAAICGP